VRRSRKALGAARSERSCPPGPSPSPPPVWSGQTGLRAQRGGRPRGEAANLNMSARVEWAHLGRAGGCPCACVRGAGSVLEAGGGGEERV